METKVEFIDALDREAGDEALHITEFENAFNAIHEDLRKEEDVKGEWMLRCEELQEALWKTCDEEIVRYEQLVQSLFEDAGMGFQNDLFAALQQRHIDLIQTEIDK